MNSRLYPTGSGAVKELYINNTHVAYGVAKTLRTRFTTAQLNATAVFLAALPGVRWRVLDIAMIAIGGNAAVCTSVNLAGVVSGSAVELTVVAIAALTRSAVVRAGATNAVVLADGASFTQMDVNTALTAKTVGSAMTTATHVDYIVTYVADPA